MAIIQNVSRRSFLTALGIGGGGLVIGFSLYRGSGPGLGIDASPPATFTPNVFLWIDRSGLVSIIAHRSEMGQGIRTSTTMIVADELEADWARVRVVQGEGDEKKVRRPEHRRVAQHQRGLQTVARGGRRRAHDARSGGRGRVEGARVRGAREESSGRACRFRPGTRLRSARRGGGGAARPGGLHVEAQAEERVPLHWQVPADRGRTRHHHGPSGLRHRHDAARHEARRHRPAAGVRGQARLC